MEIITLAEVVPIGVGFRVIFGIIVGVRAVGIVVT